MSVKLRRPRMSHASAERLCTTSRGARLSPELLGGRIRSAPARANGAMSGVLKGACKIEGRAQWRRAGIDRFAILC